MRPIDYASMPGGDFVALGLSDLENGRETVYSLLVSIGEPRLRELGVRLRPGPPSPERRLYELLASTDANSAHSRYNALIRRLVSFERALRCAS